MQMSPTIGALAAALAKAQAAMRPAQKDRENPFFKSAYATLASCMDAIREPFAANGLAVVQPTRVDDHGNVFVTTAILHSSGEWISGESSAKPVKSDPQGIGSLISYLRRYGLQSMTGLTSADEDDDANEATHKTPPPVKAQPVEDIYYNNDKAAKGLASVLKKEKVAEEFWEAIGKGLHGKPKSELGNVINAVISRAGSI